MAVANYNYRCDRKLSLVSQWSASTMVVLIFGVLFASATAFDTLGLSPRVVEPNFEYVNNHQVPVEVPNRSRDQDCPQNELLVKILNILNNPVSLNRLDGNTKTYVLSLLQYVLQNSANNNKVANDEHDSRSNPANNALRVLPIADDKKIKLTLQYEFPATNDCKESLEYLHKIINVLNDTNTTEIVNSEMRTENPEHYKLTQDKLNKDEILKGLFDNTKTNIMGLLQNYRPEVSVPVRDERNEYLSPPEKVYNPSPNPSLNLIPIDYNVNKAPEYLPNYDVQINKQLVIPKTEKLAPVENVLWKNSNIQHMNIYDQSLHGSPNNALKDVLKVFPADPQPTKISSSETKLLKGADLPRDNVLPNVKVVPNNNGQSVTVINNQNLNQDQVLAPVSMEKFENQPYLSFPQVQYQPGANFVSAKQSLNNNNIVEITYVLQQPKAVHYEPVYLIKYRLPLGVFEETVHKLILIKPYLKQDPNQLYQELLTSLKLDNRFSQITEMRSDEINYLNSNKTEKADDMLRSKVNDIEDELKIIKELNSNVSSSDLFVINNGTVESELKRLKRHPVQSLN